MGHRLTGFHRLCLLGRFCWFEIADENALVDGIIDSFVNLSRIFRIDNRCFIEDTTFWLIFANENIFTYAGDNNAF